MKRSLVKFISFFIVKKRNKDHFWRKHYYDQIKQREEQAVQIKLSPKLDWSLLYEQYLRMDIDKLYHIYRKEFLKSDILHDENDWFYLTYLCLLLYKKQGSKLDYLDKKMLKASI